MQTEAQQLRWEAWHSRPRFAVATDLGPWAVVAVALQQDPGDNALLALFRSMHARQCAAAWAVEKTSGQIYRLAASMPRFPRLTHAAMVTSRAVRAEPRQAPPLPASGVMIPAAHWEEPVQRIRWEAHLLGRSHWTLSLCPRRLTRVAHQGESPQSPRAIILTA